MHSALLLMAVAISEPLVEHPLIREIHKEAIAVRSAAGISSHYELDEDCCKLAQEWANTMAAGNFMGHGPNDQCVAVGYATPQSAIMAWRNSGGHWAWVGGRSQRCGWGAQQSSSGQWYWCAVFRGSGQETIVTTSDDYSGSYSSYGRRRIFVRRR